MYFFFFFFFFQAEDGIRGWSVTGVQTCALPISPPRCWLPPPQRPAPSLRRGGDAPRAVVATPLREGAGRCGGGSQHRGGAAGDVAQRFDNWRDHRGQIGRASCRDRGKVTRGAAS